MDTIEITKKQFWFLSKILYKAALKKVKSMLKVDEDMLGMGASLESYKFLFVTNKRVICYDTKNKMYSIKSISIKDIRSIEIDRSFLASTIEIKSASEKIEVKNIPFDVVDELHKIITDLVN
jgi:hypothetical protein